MEVGRCCKSGLFPLGELVVKHTTAPKRFAQYCPLQQQRRMGVILEQTRMVLLSVRGCFVLGELRKSKMSSH